MKNAFEAPNGWAAAVVTLIEAVMLAMIGSGMLTMSSDTVQLWVNVAAAAMIVLAPVIGFLWTSRRTTPQVKPTDEDGEPLVRADGAIPKAQMSYEFGRKPR
jgi:hypothetical protein